MQSKLRDGMVELDSALTRKQRKKGKTLMLEYDRLKELVAAAEDDIIKAKGGNKAAGTRVRKSMQDIKQAAQQVRLKILEQRSTE